jgi:hypothetical protein
MPYEIKLNCFTFHWELQKDSLYIKCKICYYMDITAFETVLDSSQYTFHIYNKYAFVKPFTDSHIYIYI